MTNSSALTAGDWPMWRGADRTDVSQETGLLKEWPAEGPKQLWVNKDVGAGYSSHAIVGGRTAQHHRGDGQRARDPEPW